MLLDVSPSPTLMCLPVPDAECLLASTWIDRGEANTLFDALSANLAWREESIQLFGRDVPVPRRTAWYGDSDCVYTYSGLQLRPSPWTPMLADLRERVERACDVHFNSVLANLYRDGRDSMGWHSDDEPELGVAPVIASVSLGATRRLRMRHRDRSHSPLGIDLVGGSLFVMRGSTQQRWQHSVPKRLGRNGPGARINLTFRRIVMP